MCSSDLEHHHRPKAPVDQRGRFFCRVAVRIESRPWERLHVSETLRLDAQLSYVAGLEQGTLRLTTHDHDRFATRADKREGANSSFVHFAQVTTVLGSEG